MKAALTIWNDRISPVFDTAVRILLVEVKDRKVTPRGSIDMRGMSPGEKVDSLKRSGVELLICGAVSNLYVQLLAGEDIDLIPWVSGMKDAILEAFACGELGPTKFLMPGCSRRRGVYGNGRRAGNKWRRRNKDADSDNIDRTN